MFTFNQGGFDGPPKRCNPRAFLRELAAQGYDRVKLCQVQQRWPGKA